MDDEKSIRKLSSQILSRLGYESELAKDGAQAIVSSSYSNDPVMTDFKAYVMVLQEHCPSLIQKKN